MTSTQDSAAIQAVQLSKFYGNFAAIQDVSFEVPRGQVAAFLGPNGAGKSTTLKILTGFLRANQGQREDRWLGYRYAPYRSGLKDRLLTGERPRCTRR